MKILRVAGQLALLPENRADGVTWHTLEALVKDLPTSARNRLIERLSKSDQLAGNESAIKAYIEEEIARRQAYPVLEEDIAHDIFGIIQLPVFTTTPDDSPYMEMLSMAGDLELPAGHRDSSSTWERFAVLVRNLPAES